MGGPLVSLIEFSKHLPPCSRCGGSLITSAIMPKDDDEGRPIHLVLCPACDRDRPAAAALLRWFASSAAHDPARVEEGGRLLVEWAKEGMATHGWDWVDDPGDDLATSNSTPPPDALGPAMDPAVDSAARVTRLQAERDALRARLSTAGPGEHENLKAAIRELGEALAQALLTSDTAAQELRLRAPRPAPGPLSPEAEQRIQEFYQQLRAEQDQLDADGED